jgi:alpha-L-rhamnosidase
VDSDETWEVTRDTPWAEASFYNGETFDPMKSLDKSRWHPASNETGNLRFKPHLVPDYGVPVRRHEEFHPLSITKAPSGETIYDFGQNFAGIVSFKTRHTRPGQRIRIRHAEILMDGELFTAPLRTARAEFNYICSGAQFESFSPRFTYMGFRYASVSGIESENIELSAHALYSKIETSGTFECGDPRLNRLQSNIVWSAKSNFVDIPTDCPQRNERMGWTGDIALFAPSACFNFDMRAFLQKWLDDLKEEQGRGGGVSVVVPRHGFSALPRMAVGFWGDACLMVPWALYRAYGERRILEEMYPVMRRYLKAVKWWAQFTDFGLHRRLWRLWHQYGDWCAPDTPKMWAWMNRGKHTASAAWANSCSIAADTAEVLGKPDEAAAYRKLRGQIIAQYRKVLTNGRGKLKKEFPSAYVLPLYFDMFEGEERREAAANLAALVRKQGWHVGTGFPGTPYVLFALADNGYAEDAMKMLLCDTCPSWLYEVKVGGTTVWERWDALKEDGTCNTGSDDGTHGMLSFNHYSYGSVGDFLYRRVAGIEALEPGYRRFQIAPLKEALVLGHAAASLETAYGKISSAWRVEGGVFSIDFTVPPGTECRLVLPGGKEAVYKEGSYRVSA